MPRMLAERELTVEGPARVEGRTGGGRAKRTVTVNLAESPLTWLHARGHLGDRQFDAGERLRADWERAQLAPSITMRWDPVQVRGSGTDQGLTAGERQLAARARFDGAVAAAGPGLADILWRVVCAGESLPVAEKALAWPVRSGKLVLRRALDRVADFYKLP
jgi:hypothetical protein